MCTVCMYLFYNCCATLHISKEHFISFIRTVAYTTLDFSDYVLQNLYITKFTVYKYVQCLKL